MKKHLEYWVFWKTGHAEFWNSDTQSGTISDNFTKYDKKIDEDLIPDGYKCIRIAYDEKRLEKLAKDRSHTNCSLVDNGYTPDDTFISEGICIHNPFSDENEFFEVDPQEYYDNKYLEWRDNPPADAICYDQGIYC